MARRPPRLDIRLLGPPEVLVDGAPIVVDTRKAIAILAILAADGRAYARDELAALLWPDSDDMSARGALRRTLSALRAAVGPEVLRVERGRVDLVRDMVRIDLHELEVSGRSSRPADLARAADLARGPFLAGFSLRDSPDFDDWRAARAMGVERTVAAVLDRLSDANEAAGDLAAAIETAGRRSDLDPLDEGAHVRLMDLYAAGGDRPAAIRQYRACVAILERELGVGPLPETTSRYEAIRDAGPVARSAAATPSVVPSPSAGRLPLVGRDAAWAAVEAVSADATSDGRIVVLTGEAGIGKTRLAEAFIARVRQSGGSIVMARAHAAERLIAYGSIVELLRSGLADHAVAGRLRALDVAALGELHRLLPGIGGGGRVPDASGSGAHARLVSAITEAMSAVAGSPPGVIWLDDLQWADAASLEALAYLARRLAGRPLILLFTWRGEELDDGSLAFARAVEADPAATVVELDRLDRAALEILVSASLGAPPSRSSVDALFGASEGLPLYVVESLARGADPDGSMPDGVRAMLRARLATVDGAAEQVLAAGAAIGRSFDLETVRYASGRSEGETVVALEELQRRGLIRDVPGSQDVQYDFAHGALRDLTEESTSFARRRLLHRRIAEALRMDVGHAGRDDLGRLVRIAQHERDAGRDAEAAEAFREAGDRATTLYANRAAIGHYTDAIALGHPDIVGLYGAVGVLRTRLGDYGGAIAAFEAAAALATPADLPAIELSLARAHIRRGDLGAAEQHLESGLATVADPRLRAQMLVDQSLVRRRAGSLDAAADAATQALAYAESTNDLATIGAAHRTAGLIALDRGDVTTARTSLQLALAAADTDPDPTAAVAALVGLALTEAAAGSIDLGLHHGQLAAARCRQIGDRHLEAAVENHLADLLHADGREADAMTHQLRAVAAFAEVGGDPADPDPGIWMLSMS